MAFVFLLTFFLKCDTIIWYCKVVFSMEIEMKKIFLILLVMIFTVSLCLTAIPISAEDRVDKSELEAIIKEAQAIREEDYNTTITNWLMFQNMLGIVEGIYEDDSVTQEEVNSAVDNLRSRISKLGPKNTSSSSSFDTSEIEALVAEAKLMQRGDYSVTDAEWSNFQSQIRTTEYALSNGNEANIINNANNLDSLVNNIKAMKNNGDAIGVFPNPDSSIKIDSVMGEGQFSIDNGVIIVQTEKVMPKSTAEFAKGGFVYLGCGSTVAASALVIVGIIGAALAIKKKED